jgi:hypothetical protein
MGVIFLALFGLLIFATRNNKSDYMKRKEAREKLNKRDI